MTVQIGFIGLGAMGLPMATTLVSKQFSVRGFDMRAEAVAALVESGGKSAISAVEAANGTDFLILMVVNAAQASLTRIPDFAATPVAARMAVGVARPKAQGQAMTSTATELISAVS